MPAAREFVYCTVVTKRANLKVISAIAQSMGSNMHRWTYGCLALASMVFVLAPSLSWAQGTPVYGQPIYDPVSKRYFELQYHFAREWKEDKAEAATHQFKGVQGRLANVDSAGVHSFLLLHFRPNTTTWVGMEYMCEKHVLLDSTGKQMDGHTFQAWAEDWKPDFYACNNGTVAKEIEYMPIAYTPVELGSAKSFRWTGWGVAKRFDAYFIEYPTGAP